MSNSMEKISSLEEKIQGLQLKKKRLEENLDKTRLQHLKKIGLFDLADDEAYGLIIDSLKHKDNKRGVWKTQGDRFLQTANSRNKKVKK